jgi:hypothetical protein
MQGEIRIRRATMPNLDTAMPEMPAWVAGKPPDVTYDLIMFEPGGGSIDGWEFSLTRAEFLALRDHLAAIRYGSAVVPENS